MRRITKAQYKRLLKYNKPVYRTRHGYWRLEVH